MLVRDASHMHAGNVHGSGNGNFLFRFTLEHFPGYDSALNRSTIPRVLPRRGTTRSVVRDFVSFAGKRREGEINKP